MESFINKLTKFIKLTTGSSDVDATKVLAGVTILAISISWFVLGGLFNSGDIEISDEDMKEFIQLEIDTNKKYDK